MVKTFTSPNNWTYLTYLKYLKCVMFVREFSDSQVASVKNTVFFVICVLRDESSYIITINFLGGGALSS
jgi:hypothetical protein